MKIFLHRWIFLLVLALIILIGADFSDYRIYFEDHQYLVEGILQVLPADLDNNRQDELVLAGKNYIAREVYLYWLTADQNFKPVIQWQSENLFEDRSIIWAVTGKFSKDQNQLLAFSNSQYYLYQINENHVDLIKQEKHSIQLLNIAGGDVDGDGRREIIVARVGKVTSKAYNCQLQVWKFKGDQPELLVESDLMGNIRGIAAGDIDQDGVDEVFVDEGVKFAPGNMHVLKMVATKLSEVFLLRKAAKGPIYGMRVKSFPEGPLLVTATATGYIDFFKWEDNALKPTGKEINLGRGVMSFTVADLNNDNIPELIVAGYPNDLMILSK